MVLCFVTSLFGFRASIRYSLGFVAANRTFLSTHFHSFSKRFSLWFLFHSTQERQTKQFFRKQ